MNQLSFAITDDNTLSFALLVDGQPIVQPNDPKEALLTAWLCDAGIPISPDHEPAGSRVLIAVCSCGEYGCGNSNARLERKNGRVRLFDFEGSGVDGLTEYQFDEAQYDQVSHQIGTLARVQTAIWQQELAEKTMRPCV